MQTFVCLLSQTADISLNLEAALEVNPHSVIICHTKESEKEAIILQIKLLDALGAHAQLVPVPAFDLDGIQDIAEQLFMSLQNRQSVLHYTGGTKPMALGFFEEFRGSGCSLLYTDLETRTLWWRGPEGFHQKPMQQR